MKLYKAILYWAFLGAVILSLLPSCTKFEDPKFLGIQKVKIGKIDMNETTMEMDILFNNPNRMGVTLNNASGKTWIQDVYVGEFTMAQDVIVPARSNFVMPVKFSLNMKDLITNSLSFMFSDSVNIKVDGGGKASKGSFTKNFPINFNGKKSSAELLKALKPSGSYD